MACISESTADTQPRVLGVGAGGRVGRGGREVDAGARVAGVGALEGADGERDRGDLLIAGLGGGARCDGRVAGGGRVVALVEEEHPGGQRRGLADEGHHGVAVSPRRRGDAR
jgi:hypothetical protein